MADPSARPPVISNARVFAIAGPAMLANLTTPLLGIVGTAVIGRLGEAHLLGGVAMSALVFDCLFWLFGFLRMGTVALTAQATGARDLVEQRAVLMRALVIAAVIGLLLIVLQVPLAAAAYGALGSSEAVRAAAETYFFVRVWSAPCALANFAVLGWLIGIARAGTALVLQIAINTANIVFTVLLVLVLDYGIAGAAAAALIAEACGLALGLAMARHRLGGHLRTDAALVLQRNKLVRMLAINRDIMIRTAALIAAFAFFTAQGARAGDVALAANAVLHNFILIGSFFLDGLATAAEQLCGRSVGARDGAAFAQAARRVLAWGLLFGAAVHAVRGAGAGGRRRRLYLRRHLYRRHLGARHAQPDGGRAGDLSGDLVGAQGIRQCRAMDGAAGVPGRARSAAGGALSGAGAGDVRWIDADRLSSCRRHCGHGSAVIAAASAPTSSSIPACPPRESALDRSDLMLGISRRPWKTSAL
jgi:MATE family multidrug resistance protein